MAESIEKRSVRVAFTGTPHEKSDELAMETKRQFIQQTMFEPTMPVR